MTTGHRLRCQTDLRLKSLNSNFHMWSTTLGFQIVFRRLKNKKQTPQTSSAWRLIWGSLLNLLWRSSLAPQSEHKEERRDYRWGSHAEPLASEHFTVISHRCVLPALGHCISISDCMQLQSASQCEGVSIRLLQKKIQL